MRSRSWDAIVSTFIFLLFVFYFSNYAYADIECLPWQDEYQYIYDIYIGTITIDANNIFDPKNHDENHRIHRIANALHSQTRYDTIRSQLLFHTGDKFDMRVLEETARNLRSNRYIKDANIYPQRLCGNEVDVIVTTTDNWTLTPSVSYGRSSGTSKSGISVKEENLFGLGKKLSFGFKSGVDRKENVLRYTDPQFMGTYKELSLSAQDNSDGEGYGLDYRLPFYQLDSRQSWGVSLNTLRRKASIYNNGNLSEEIAENYKGATLSYGWSNGLQGTRVKRTSIGWLYDANQYSGLNGSSPAISQNRVSYPWFELETFNEDYIQKYNFRTMGQVEDISLGMHLKGRLGLLSTSLGSSDNYLYLATAFSQGFQVSEKQLGLLSFDLENYTGDGILNGSTINLSGEWFWFQNSKSNYYASARFSMIDNLLPGQQVVLGSETGLRGYPLRYQTGDKSLLVTAEKHFFFRWYPYRLVQFGAVLFADAGSAWGQGKPRKLIADAGVGLRLVSTRSTGSSVLHIDLAFPYNAPADIDSYQIKLSAEKTL